MTILYVKNQISTSIFTSFVREIEREIETMTFGGVLVFVEIQLSSINLV